MNKSQNKIVPWKDFVMKSPLESSQKSSQKSPLKSSQKSPLKSLPIPDYDFDNKDDRKEPYFLNITTHGEYVMCEPSKKPNQNPHDLIDMEEFPYITRLLKINISQPYSLSWMLIKSGLLIKQLQNIKGELTLSNIGEILAKLKYDLMKSKQEMDDKMLESFNKQFEKAFKMKFDLKTSIYTLIERKKELEKKREEYNEEINEKQKIWVHIHDPINDKIEKEIEDLLEKIRDIEKNLRETHEKIRIHNYYDNELDISTRNKNIIRNNQICRNENIKPNVMIDYNHFYSNNKCTKSDNDITYAVNDYVKGRIGPKQGIYNKLYTVDDNDTHPEKIMMLKTFEELKKRGIVVTHRNSKTSTTLQEILEGINNELEQKYKRDPTAIQQDIVLIDQSCNYISNEYKGTMYPIRAVNGGKITKKYTISKKNKTKKRKTK